MEYMVIYEDEHGQLMSTKQMREKQKNDFIKTLTCNYEVKECPDRLWNCPLVVFDLQKIEEARKAVSQGKNIPGVIYICGDKDKIAKRNSVVKVQCTNGVRVGFVIHIWKATFDEIVAYKEKIKYPHLSMIVGKL